MGTVDRITELQNLRRKIEQGGGEEKTKKQHDAEKLTARERISELLDEGSFVEVDAFVKHRCTEFEPAEAPAEGVVTGYGTVDGRLVFVYSQDFTVIGGSLGEMHAKKICKILDMAAKMGAPVVAVSDSGGARIQEGVNALAGYGEIFRRKVMNSGVIPQIEAVMGPCAGAAALGASLSDFVIMTEKTAAMFVNGASVIQGATGKSITNEELGGAEAHAAKSGIVSLKASNDREGIADIKRLLSYLPSNNLEEAPLLACTDDINRISEKLMTIVPDSAEEAYDIRNIIAEIADNGEFFEISADFAKNMVTGFIRMSGMTVGVAANQPAVSKGMLDTDGADKAAKLVRVCDSFNIPVLTFTDTPGFIPETEQEQRGMAKCGARLLYAFAEATVPKINVIVGKAYGSAYAAMNSKNLGADMVYAWPTAEISVMAPEGAANLLFGAELAESSNPIEDRKTKIEEYRSTAANPYAAAAEGYVDDIIEPDSTRPRIIAALELLASKRETRPAKKHGNMPV